MEAQTGTVLYEKKCVGTAKPGEHHKNHDAAADF